MDSEFLTIQSELIASFNAYAEGLDSKNWPLVRQCFADEVLIDYGAISAATGGADVPRKTEDWMKHLTSVINGFDVTRHTITNHRVTVSDSVVNCTAYLTADHVIFPNPEMPIATPEDVATVVGEYSNDYQQIDGVWKIVKSALVVNWSSGNMQLFEVALGRTAGA